MDRPEWASAVEAAFAGLAPPHLEKKKATVIALVDARLAQRPEETIWKLPETCSRRVWHEKWKQDPAIQAAVQAVYEVATGWRDLKAVNALRLAAERLALASPVAATVAAEKLRSEDDGVALRAAFGILDRADFSTAAKRQAQVEEVEMDGFLGDEEQAALEAALRALAEGN